MANPTGLICLADVQPERVSWLWPNRIPLGKLVTVDGDPGLGKSTLATAIGATVTVGGEWPDGTKCDYPGDVVLMAAEDGLADTIRPRYDAAGANTDRVHALEGVPYIDEENRTSLRPPTLSDIATLEPIIKAKNAAVSSRRGDGLPADRHRFA